MEQQSILNFFKGKPSQNLPKQQSPQQDKENEKKLYEKISNYNPKKVEELQFYQHNEQEFQQTNQKINPDLPYYMFYSSCCQGNPGPGACSYSILDQLGKQIFSNAILCGNNNTNNQCEYLAVISGLHSTLLLGIQRLKIYGHSELIIKQIKGDWKCKQKDLSSLLQIVLELQGKLENFEIIQINKKQNKRTTDLASKLLYQN